MSREDLLTELMICGTGYEVDLFGMLYLRPLENGEFEVGREDCVGSNNKDNWYRCFKDARKAVQFFEKTRKEQELGYEFEVETK